MDHLYRNINWAKPGQIEDACPEMGSRLKNNKKLSKFIVTFLIKKFYKKWLNNLIGR